MSYLTSTYTGTDVSSYVKRQFGDESGVQITDEDIVHWINAGVNEIFRKNEPVKAIAQTDVTVDVSEYTFPPDVFKVQSILYNGVPLEQKHIRKLKSIYCAKTRKIPVEVILNYGMSGRVFHYLAGP